MIRTFWYGMVHSSSRDSSVLRIFYLVQFDLQISWIRVYTPNTRRSAGFPWSLGWYYDLLMATPGCWPQQTTQSVGESEMNLNRFAGVLLILLHVSVTACVTSAADLSVKSALKQRIIDPQLPLAEIQAYTEARILPMPELTNVADWEAYANHTRQNVLDNVVFRGEAQAWRSIPTRVEWLETIEGGPGYHIQKLRYEVVPGLWVAALLYEPDQLNGKVPVVMNVNGHERPDGKAVNYKQLRCINLVKRGMIALNIEWLGMGQLNTPGFDHYRMNQLNLCGTSGLAPFYLSMSRGLDILLRHRNADPKRVAVAGLSGGGWQTIFISSLDERVTFCNPVAGYSSFRTRSRFLSDMGDSEQTPCDLASITDYAQLTAMLAPRPVLLTKNAEDNCCFRAEHALPPLLEAAQPVYRMYGKPDHLRYHVNHDPGTHNFGLDNRLQLYAAIGDFFYPDHPDFLRTEIASDDEVKSKEELFVELPDNNLDFNTLALQISSRHERSLPHRAEELKAWQREQRPRLAQLVRAHDYQTVAIEHSSQSSSIGSAIWRWLRIDGNWTVPSVEIFTPQSDPAKLTIVISDQGRASAILDTSILLSAGHRVLALDPFYFGESKIAERDFLFAILLSSIGDRPLGLQASQILSVARWAKAEQGVEQIRIVADGPRTSLIALVAAALSEDVIDGVETFGSLGSLHELIEQNKGMNEVPESLCFGLLKHFDIAQLAALVLPRGIQFHNMAGSADRDVRLVIERLRP